MLKDGVNMLSTRVKITDSVIITHDVSLLNNIRLIASIYVIDIFQIITSIKLSNQQVDVVLKDNPQISNNKRVNLQTRKQVINQSKNQDPKVKIRGRKTGVRNPSALEFSACSSFYQYFINQTTKEYDYCKELFNKRDFYSSIAKRQAYKLNITGYSTF